MKKFGKVSTLALSIAFALACAGCSNGSGDGFAGFNDESVSNGEAASGGQLSGDGFDKVLFATDRYKTTHVKIENVKGGIKFTIKRPEGDYYDPKHLIREEGEWYEYVGQGKGDHVQDSWENVGAGKGNYSIRFVYHSVGNGNGDYEFDEWEYVGQGKGDNNGDYKQKFKYVGQGNGGFIRILTYEWVGDNNGDYKQIIKYVGEGNGDRIKKSNKVYGAVCWTAVERIEMLGGSNERPTSAAVVAIDNAVDEWTCLYPLCKPGERCVFKVRLQPIDVDNHRELEVCEWLSIIAQDGVGNIDYSNLNEARRLELTYDGEKPTSTVFNFSPPILPASAKNLLSVIEYVAGTSEWATGTTYWIAEYSQDVSNYVFDKDPCMEDVKSWAKPEEVERYRASRCFNATVKSKGKKQFFSEQFYKFQLPEAQGISEFRTINIRSNYAYMN